jgi:hypothetical protein
MHTMAGVWQMLLAPEPDVQSPSQTPLAVMSDHQCGGSTARADVMASPQLRNHYNLHSASSCVAGALSYLSPKSKTAAGCWNLHFFAFLHACTLAALAAKPATQQDSHHGLQCRRTIIPLLSAASSTAAGKLCSASAQLEGPAAGLGCGRNPAASPGTSAFEQSAAFIITICLARRTATGVAARPATWR